MQQGKLQLTHKKSLEVRQYEQIVREEWQTFYNSVIKENHCQFVNFLKMWYSKHVQRTSYSERFSDIIFSIVLGIAVKTNYWIFVASVFMSLLFICTINKLDVLVTFHKPGKLSEVFQIKGFQQQLLCHSNSSQDNKNIQWDSTKDTQDLQWLKYGKDKSDVALLVNAWLCLEDKTRVRNRKNIVIYSSEHVDLHKVC